MRAASGGDGRTRRRKSRRRRPLWSKALQCCGLGIVAFLGGLYVAYFWSLVEQGEAPVRAVSEPGEFPAVEALPSPALPPPASGRRSSYDAHLQNATRVASVSSAPNALPPAAVRGPDPVGDPAAEQGAERAVLAPSTPDDGDSERLHGPGAGEAPWTQPGVLVVAYDRPQYLERTLRSLSRLAGLAEVDVMVSRDGDHPGVARVAEEARALFEGRAAAYSHWSRPRSPDPRSPRGAGQPGTAWLAQHYGFALGRSFARAPARSHLIVVEDDMVASPDFLSLMRQTAALLAADPSLLCVSSWNDNGYRTLDLDPARLFRTSYFPGLGWMLTRRLWDELGPKWPLDHWDHWMRSDDVHRGRDCVAPELSRNRNIGEEGVNVSPGAFRAKLAGVAWSDAPAVDLGDIGYLRAARWERDLRREIERARPWGDLPFAAPSVARVAAAAEPGRAVLVPFRHATFPRLASALGINDVPRAHYRHVLRIRKHGVLFLLAHAALSPLLPPSLRVQLPAGFALVAAPKGMSCKHACSLAGARTPEVASGGGSGPAEPPLIRVEEGAQPAALRGRGEEGALRCASEHFEQVNTCAALHRAFACEAGCGMVLGPDVPNYVADARNEEHHRRCLFTEKESTCSAKHWSTARLCPCASS